MITLIWAIVMFLDEKANEAECWYSFGTMGYYWINDIPRIIIISVRMRSCMHTIKWCNNVITLTFMLSRLISERGSKAINQIRLLWTGNRDVNLSI